MWMVAVWSEEDCGGVVVMVWQTVGRERCLMLSKRPLNDEWEKSKKTGLGRREKKHNFILLIYDLEGNSKYLLTFFFSGAFGSKI